MGRSGRYVLRDGIVITITAIAPVSDVSLCKISTAIFASKMVQILRVGTKRNSLAVVLEASSECDRNVLDAGSG